MKKTLLSLLLLATAATTPAQTLLFHTGDSTGSPYRIPAIAATTDGELVALSDWRPCRADIGAGRVDIVGRTSRDNGRTWSKAFKVLEGTGKGREAGYGDACLVADRKRKELLLVCVSGDVLYRNSRVEHSQRFVYTHGRWDKERKAWTWDAPTDLTKQIYGDLFGGNVNGLFMGSGRICQSRMVKTGRYYRLYGALCTHKGNFVLYSDDFGRSWAVLGSNVRPCVPQGDEPKCEELPDGSVVISSRKSGGRYFNIFRFRNPKTAEGEWGEAIDSREAPGGIRNEGGPCNGEILIVPARRADGKRTRLVLQSVPAGPGRSNVTVYWKELASPADYDTPLHFASNWEGSFKVTDKGSAYSTMTVQKDGRIGFFYEEEPDWYQMIYRPLRIEEITGGKFRATRNK